jgi:hypothetical protein
MDAPAPSMPSIGAASGIRTFDDMRRRFDEIVDGMDHAFWT